jgi:hypothetical protein
MMRHQDTSVPAGGGRLRIPRSRGAASGLLLIAFGAWGALIPFVGPYFDFAYSPDQAWTWTPQRGWLELLPGVVTVVGGLLLLASRNRATAMLGSWLAVFAGAWFVVGRAVASVLNFGTIGAPTAATDAKVATLEITYFYGLGALIVFLGAVALGRLSVRSARDVAYAQRLTPAAPAPAAAEPAIEEQPTAAIERPRHRPFGRLFGRRHTHAH